MQDFGLVAPCAEVGYSLAYHTSRLIRWAYLYEKTIGESHVVVVVVDCSLFTEGGRRRRTSRNTTSFLTD